LAQATVDYAISAGLSFLAQAEAQGTAFDRFTRGKAPTAQPWPARCRDRLMSDDLRLSHGWKIGPNRLAP